MWIADVFGRERGEGIDLDDIPELFHRSREMDVLERPDNHFILGAKGSGKSTALRAMTYRAWRQRSPADRLPFLGVYLPMAFDDVSVFNTTFEERRYTGLFEHFFATTLFGQFLQQLQGFVSDALLVDLLRPFIPAHPQGGSIKLIADALVSDRYLARDTILNDPLTPVEDASFLCRVLTLRDIDEFAERYSLLANADGLPSRLGLLLDSFDYYGSLGGIFAHLLQSDSGVPLAMKIAARTLHLTDVFGSAPTRQLEIDRDYKIVSLDRPTDDAEHKVLVRNAICRRARALGPPTAQGMDDELIIHTLFQGGDDDDDLTSFESFCRLSSGNILAAILLLDKAAEIQRATSADPPGDIEPLRRESRLRAVSEVSQYFWEREIGVRLPAQKLEAMTLCDVAAATAKDALPDDHLSPRFAISAVSPDKSLLANMLATRVLTATDDSVNRVAQSGFDIPPAFEFELNRLLLPRYHRLPRAGGRVELQRHAFDSAYKKALRAARPHLSPMSRQHQRDLFKADFSVFVSMPYDLAKRARTTVLRTAVARLYREQTGRAGGEGVSHVDIHFLPSVGPFRAEIPRYIRDSSYVVADISDVGLSPELVPGVFYEIGIALAERKPLALFYNMRSTKTKAPPFKVEYLPPVLRGESVLVWDERKQSFYEEFSRVHQKLIAYNGVWIGDDVDRTAAEPGYAYLSFEPRNSEAQEWFARLIKMFYPELRIERARDWGPDDLPALVKLVAGAELCLIDCTGRVNSQALELGIAAASGSKRVLEVWDSTVDRSVNPVAMFPGRKWAWADLDATDKEHAAQLLRDIARVTSLGRRRI